MRLATRTGLAALAASSVSMLLIGAVFNRTLPQLLQERVDAQLADRAETAPILAAVADRLARSELSGTVAGARVVRDGELVEIGQLPADPLPAVETVGLTTATADGERWRLLTIEVVDVPNPGDRTLVQLAEPLGDVDQRTTELRRRAVMIGLLTVAIAGAIGFVLGRRATRPLTELRADADRWDDGDPATWTVADRYGSPEVDDVAGALNVSLARLGQESERRDQALDAARAFAASATHELRTPLQSALTNIDIARSPLVDDAGRRESVEQAHVQLQRLASGLGAVRALADAEFAELSWFVPTDLEALVTELVAGEHHPNVDLALHVTPASRSASNDVSSDSPPLIPLWADGVRLAVSNVIRNAAVHGRPAEPLTVSVHVDGVFVVVDDDGVGIPAADRGRLVERFERGAGSSGSGLGLAIAHQVAVAHGGGVSIGDSPAGGARVTLQFGAAP